MQTRTIEAFNVTSVIPFTRECNLVGISGYYSGAGSEWLQIHDVTTLPADLDGVVPLLSVKLAATANIPEILNQFAQGPMRLRNGLCIAISKDEGKLTIATSKMFLTILVEEFETSLTDLGAATSTTSETGSLQVWAADDSTHQRRLLRASISAVAGRDAATKRWLLVCDDVGLTHVLLAVPLFTLDNYNAANPTVTNITSLTIDFGLGGRSMGNGIGCFLSYSDDPTSGADLTPTETCTLTGYYL